MEELFYKLNNSDVSHFATMLVSRNLAHHRKIVASIENPRDRENSYVCFNFIDISMNLQKRNIKAGEASRILRQNQFQRVAMRMQIITVLITKTQFADKECFSRATALPSITFLLQIL